MINATPRTMTLAMFRVVDALVAQGPMTAAEIAKAAHVSWHTAKGWCVPILVANGMIYRSDWRLIGYNYTPVYSAGVGDPAPRPTRTREARLEYLREWKIRTGWSDARKAERRLRRPPDRALAALLGMGQERRISG